MLTRYFVFALTALFVVSIMNGCPSKSDESASVDQSASTSTENIPTAPSGQISSIGTKNQSSSDSNNIEKTASDATSPPPVGVTPPKPTPKDPSGNPYKTIKGEIVALDNTAKTVEFLIDGGDPNRTIKMPVSDLYPKCVLCGDDLPVKPGDKGEFFVDITPEGKMTFVGLACECETPGEGNCADCKNKKSE